MDYSFGKRIRSDTDIQGNLDAVAAVKIFDTRMKHLKSQGKPNSN